MQIEKKRRKVEEKLLKSEAASLRKVSTNQAEIILNLKTARAFMQKEGGVLPLRVGANTAGSTAVL